jgi:glutaredoxin 3
MDKKVKIYTTPTCGYCKQAKEYLTEKGIDFEALDVTTDKDALQEMKQITNGGRSVPVIAVGEEVLVGFDRGALEKALQSLE